MTWLTWKQTWRNSGSTQTSDNWLTVYDTESASTQGHLENEPEQPEVGAEDDDNQDRAEPSVVSRGAWCDRKARGRYTDAGWRIRAPPQWG